jgi:hypothetical protein
VTPPVADGDVTPRWDHEPVHPPTSTEESDITDTTSRTTASTDTGVDLEAAVAMLQDHLVHLNADLVLTGAALTVFGWPGPSVDLTGPHAGPVFTMIG